MAFFKTTKPKWHDDINYVKKSEIMKEILQNPWLKHIQASQINIFYAVIHPKHPGNTEEI